MVRLSIPPLTQCHYHFHVCCSSQVVVKFGKGVSYWNCFHFQWLISHMYSWWLTVMHIKLFGFTVHSNKYVQGSCSVLFWCGLLLTILPIFFRFTSIKHTGKYLSQIDKTSMEKNKKNRAKKKCVYIFGTCCTCLTMIFHNNAHKYEQASDSNSSRWYLLNIKVLLFTNHLTAWSKTYPAKQQRNHQIYGLLTHCVGDLMENTLHKGLIKWKAYTCYDIVMFWPPAEEHARLSY